MEYPGGCTGWEYIIEYVDHQLIEDRVINDNGITLFIDPKSLVMLNGSQLIFKEEGINCGIEIMNPNSTLWMRREFQCMTEEELEDWVNKNPMLRNAVYPACIVIGALILLALISFISWMLYIHSF